MRNVKTMVKPGMMIFAIMFLVIFITVKVNAEEVGPWNDPAEITETSDEGPWNDTSEPVTDPNYGPWVEDAPSEESDSEIGPWQDAAEEVQNTDGPWNDPVDQVEGTVGPWDENAADIGNPEDLEGHGPWEDSGKDVISEISPENDPGTSEVIQTAVTAVPAEDEKETLQKVEETAETEMEVTEDTVQKEAEDQVHSASWFERFINWLKSLFVREQE